MNDGVKEAKILKVLINVCGGILIDVITPYEVVSARN
jgi:hypothetical protein